MKAMSINNDDDNDDDDHDDDDDGDGDGGGGIVVVERRDATVAIIEAVESLVLADVLV